MYHPAGMRRAGPIIIIVIGALALLIDFFPNLRLPDAGAADGQWRLVDTKLGLDLEGGLRVEYQALPKDGVAPRLGMAFSPNERTLIRAGAGKFYQYQSTAIPANLFAGAVNSPVFTFDTGQDNNAAAGRFPTNVCLLPVNNGGQAQISPACRAQLAQQ